MIMGKECVLTDVCNFGRQNCKKILLSKNLTIEIQCMWNFKNKSDTSTKRGRWNHFTIIQIILEQRTGKHEIKELQKQPYLEFHIYFIKY